MRFTRRDFLRRSALALPGLLAGCRSAGTGDLKPGNADTAKALVASRLGLMTRRQWATASPVNSRLTPASTHQRLTVHHAGNAISYATERNRVADELNTILVFHRKRNYGDIGYHFLIDYAGRVWEGRSLRHEGAHVSGQNLANIGVVLLGNFEVQRPCEKQLTTLRRIVKTLCGHYGIPPNKVYGHRDLSPSACPGKNLYPFVEQIKRERKT